MTLENVFFLILSVFTIIISLVGAWIAVKISIAETKKDIVYIQTEIDRIEKISENDIKDIGRDVKDIFKMIGAIHVELAKHK